jgi:hypothetical protein
VSEAEALLTQFGDADADRGHDDERTSRVASWKLPVTP